MQEPFGFWIVRQAMLGISAFQQNIEFRGLDPLIQRTFPYTGLCPELGHGSV
jgi:hypothetical protein